jgi:hypothetical protein
MMGLWFKTLKPAIQNPPLLIFLWIGVFAPLPRVSDAKLCPKLFGGDAGP